MRVWILAGLVVIEKAQLAAQLANHLHLRDEAVALIDNLARLPIDGETTDVAPQRVEGDLLPTLPEVLDAQEADTVVVALSEQATPEPIFTAVDRLQQQRNHEITLFALIDTRTCDCFPQVRQGFEEIADEVLMLPIELEEVLARVAALDPPD